MLLKPRFGKRRCSGIWPPSKPLMATPVRAFWPLTPRPPVLPLPEPMPRPTRMRSLVAPALSANSCSFISLSLGFVDDADEMLDLGDHAPDGRCVLEGLAPADAAADLLDRDGLAFALLGHRLCLDRFDVDVAAARLQGRDLDAAAGGDA